MLELSDFATSRGGVSGAALSPEVLADKLVTSGGDPAGSPGSNFIVRWLGAAEGPPAAVISWRVK